MAPGAPTSNTTAPRLPSCAATWRSIADVVSLSRLQGGLKALAADSFTTVSGVMVVEGTLPTSVYDQLVNDPAVFAVDVTRAFVAQEVAKTNPLLTPKNFTITISPVLARMDQLGLENFR